MEDTYGAHSVKLPAGHMVLYPATSLHRVAPVTRGARVASFFWVQSMIRSDGDRTLLFDLDTAIQRLATEVPGNAAGVQLTGVYHNLCGVGRRCEAARSWFAVRSSDGFQFPLQRELTEGGQREREKEE